MERAFASVFLVFYDATIKIVAFFSRFLTRTESP